MPLRNKGFERASIGVVSSQNVTAGSTYLSLHTQEPGETGAGEVSASSYSRLEVTSSQWTINSQGRIQNNARLSFAPATEAWGTVTHVGLWDASTGGNILLDDQLVANLTPTADPARDVVTFAIGEITITPSP